MLTLEDAIALRDRGSGDPEAAEEALRGLADQGGEDWAAAGYELALLLHGRGLHEEGDSWLRRLGFRHRLADAAFHPCSGDAAAVAASPPLPLRVLDNLLPDGLLGALQAALGPDSPFWAEHRYPTPAFFSYNLDLVPPRESERGCGQGSGKAASRKKRARGEEGAGAQGTAAHEQPGGELIAAVAAALLPAVKELAAAGGPAGSGGGGERRRKKGKRSAAAEVELGSVEWWAHSRRGAGAGHQLHFDLDEAALPAWREEEEEEAEGASAAAPHPEVSCVVYLDAPPQGQGAPTLVLDQDVDDPAGSEAGRGWLCFPCTNRALLFRGGLLHGVVPAPASSQAKELVRTTLMLGFWRKGARPAAGPVVPAEGPSPNMRAPFRAAVDATLCPDGRGGKKKTKKQKQKRRELPEGAAAPSWPALFASAPPCGGVPEAGRHCVYAVKNGTVSEVAPVWVGTGRPQVGEDDARWEHDMQFVGSYFLEDSPAALRDRLLFPNSCEGGLGDEDVPRGPTTAGAAEVEMISLEELARLRGEA